MAKVNNWIHYGYNGNQLKLGDAQGCIDVMTNQGKPGLSKQYIKDFKKFSAASLRDKVNQTAPPNTNGGVHPEPNLKPGPWGGNYNWMRVTIGKLADNTPIVVILYHLLRHRVVNKEAACWSWSVGFVPSLLGDLPVGGMPAGSAFKQEYVDFAKEVATQLHTDLTDNSQFKPPGKSSVIYDQKDSKGDPDPKEPGKNETSRRATKIGELGWVFHKDKTEIPKLFTINTPEPHNPPTGSSGNEILGWSRTPGEQIAITVLDAN